MVERNNQNPYPVRWKGGWARCHRPILFPSPIVNAMHDPTEGGLSAALHELSIACGCKITVEKERIPILPESRALCGYFGIDPLGALSSGALLISTPHSRAEKVVEGLRAASIKSAVIGRVEGKGRAVRITVDGKTKALKHFERDELTRILV